MRIGKLNAPTPVPRPKAGLPIGSLRSTVTLAPFPLFHVK